MRNREYPLALALVAVAGVAYLGYQFGRQPALAIVFGETITEGKLTAYPDESIVDSTGRCNI